MLEHWQATAGLENLQLTLNIRRDVGVGVDEGVAHAGLSRKMHDAVNIGMPLQHGLQRTAFGKFHFVEGEVLVDAKLLQPGLFQRDRIVVVEIVDADDFLAALEQRSAGMHADKSGGAGEKNGHGRVGRFRAAFNCVGSYNPAGARNHQPSGRRRSLARCDFGRLLCHLAASSSSTSRTMSSGVVCPCVTQARMTSRPSKSATEIQAAFEARTRATIERTSRDPGGGSMHNIASDAPLGVRHPSAKSLALSDSMRLTECSTCVAYPDHPAAARDKKRRKPRKRLDHWTVVT